MLLLAWGDPLICFDEFASFLHYLKALPCQKVGLTDWNEGITCTSDHMFGGIR